jgi:hypothetical protein
VRYLRLKFIYSFLFSLLILLIPPDDFSAHWGHYEDLSQLLEVKLEEEEEFDPEENVYKDALESICDQSRAAGKLRPWKLGSSKIRRQCKTCYAEAVNVYADQNVSKVRIE